MGRTVAEAEAPILWTPDMKSQLTWKYSDTGKDWNQEEKGTAEDEMFDGITDSMDMNLSKLQEIVKDMEPCMLQSLGCKLLDITEQLKWTELNWSRREMFLSIELYNFKSMVNNCPKIQSEKERLEILFLVREEYNFFLLVKGFSSFSYHFYLSFYWSENVWYLPIISSQQPL